MKLILYIRIKISRIKKYHHRIVAVIPQENKMIIKIIEALMLLSNALHNLLLFIVFALEKLSKNCD